ncbi:hypothetical protein [Mariniblastus fucicola]|uniref:TRASH domain-containing protein n=1 Tax=Mariniblastus fucicola TaxID=980251 RepID=A0A5B9PEW6_9BACT|nr:hypothetical protein [Mariniblastus fucicola]QEG23156.1 hypothetical protein MFFC18_30520 [Mariniblastus fucicola]
MKNLILMAIALVSAVALAGCESKTQADPASDTDAADVTTDVSLTLTPESKAKLALADEVDGKADKVIENCYTCALGMKGKPEIATKVEGYELHFCGQSCCDYLEKDAEKVIAATKIPEPKTEE